MALGAFASGMFLQVREASLPKTGKSCSDHYKISYKEVEDGKEEGTNISHLCLYLPDLKPLLMGINFFTKKF